MASEPDTSAIVRQNIEPSSSPLSSAPPSPLEPGFATPTKNGSFPDTETTAKMSTLGLDSANDPPPKKRVKLTAEQKSEREKEKEEKRKEKEEKEKERAKLKIEKEEQKKLKDEEKAKKEAERAAEKSKRDEEKAKKEEERVRKEEEKAKKARSQLRMDTFFMKKNVPNPQPTGGSNQAAPAAPTAPIDQLDSDMPTILAPTNPQNSTPAPALAPASVLVSTATAPDVEMTERPDKSDFVKYFQPFFVRPGVTVAPVHSFQKDELALAHVCERLDREVCKRPYESDEMDVDVVQFQIPRPLPPSYFEDHFDLPPAKRRRRGNLPKFSTQQILAGLNASPGPVPDFWGAKSHRQTDYAAQLKKLPRKVFKYCEDIRPAYSGTFTRIPTTSGLRTGRNPFQQSLVGVNYDYDSEAEWVEEPADEEGEELMSEEEDDPMDVGSADEMDDFLDDETEDAAKKRHVLSGPLIPVSSGLMWEDEVPKSEDWERFRIGFLAAGHGAPIDPFSTRYWETEKKLPSLFQTPSSKPNQTATSGPSARAALPSAAQPITKSPATASKNPNSSPAQPPSNQSTSKAAPPTPMPTATHTPTGYPYSEYIKTPEIKANIQSLISTGRPPDLGSLADPLYALQVGMKTEDQLFFFKILHNIPTFTGLELANLSGFVVGATSTKLGMLEDLKKQFPHLKKGDLKRFLDGFCQRYGLPKSWICCLSQNDSGYWVFKNWPEVTSKAVS
ncbi:hypothetical protein DRE_00434 [Drechslerella stenobrocha 248]|uniref:Chromatin assembly factor 1 subunit A n=1 Tax=Drechslerella stenobrocha 248 TaxID=1043628 RepID=W7HTN1_9PEZI|nr:hypothetical protein DRE_00434 [Drechslerella stenobrocha 248]